jgi:TonB dependent receptor/CarboxypepD_reg-like domain/TonB-dependent Receptor Plug Domain
MTLKTHFSLFAFFCFLINGNAQNVRIFGKIKDKATGETLIGANIVNVATKDGTTSNEYGFYSLSVPRNGVDVEISYVGYQKMSLSLSVSRDTNMDIQLSQSIDLQTVEVTEKKNDRIEHGVVNLPIERLRSIPMLGGEADVLKALALTPGVATGTEGSNALYVRGGTPDQNLILLDGATVYNTSHLFGFMSTFNPYALKNLTLYKGGFPARFGGRLSSVIDVTMREGNTQEKSGDFTMGIINSGLNLEGPIKKGQSSYMVSGRTAYLGLISLPFKWLYNKKQRNSYNDVFIYDLNGKVNFKLDSKSQLYLSAYSSSDIFTNAARERNGNASYSTNFNWGNQTATVRYARTLSPKVFMNAMLNYNNFNYRVLNTGEGDNNLGNYRVENLSSVRDFSNKFNIDWSANAHNQVRVGWEITGSKFRPNFISSQAKNGDTLNINTNVTQNASSYAVYAEDNIKINNFLSTNIGVRGVQYQYQSKVYHSFEPRLSLQARITEGSTIEASYTRMKQFIHLLTTSGSYVSNDIWVPATNLTPPQSAEQVSLSFSKNWKKAKTELQLETFYKRMDNQIDYRSGTDFFFTNNGTWENVIERNGLGRAYGFELFLRKEAPKWSAWISYTLAWSERKFDNINKGAWYPQRYDRRHNLAIVGEYKMNDSWTVSANFVLSTGHAVTMPDASYKGFFDIYYDNGVGEPQYLKRNNQRMPLYNRLDVSFKKSFTTRNDREAAWIFSVYNLYGYPNAFSQEYQALPGPDPVNNNITYLKGESSKNTLLRFIPGISYNLKLLRGKTTAPVGKPVVY